MAAEIVERERALDQLRADFAHLDGALRLPEPAYKPGAIRPQRRHSKHGRWFATGELRRLCLDVVSGAAEPLPAMEIARAVMRRGMDSGDEAALPRVETMIAGTLRRRTGEPVEKVAIGPKAVGWRANG